MPEVRYAVVGAAAWTQHAVHLAYRRFGAEELLVRAHRVAGIERPVGKRQLANVREGRAQPAVREGRLRLPHHRLRDVDAVCARALLGRPLQDARVLRLVPEVRLENARVLEIGEMLEEEPFL